MVDYSKWNNIEVSDDEDETHPNIDTGSLFRWRHQARIERMQELEQKKQAVEKKKKEIENQKKWVSEKLKQEAEDAVKDEMKKLELEEQKLQEEESQVKNEEKKMPWNVDTLSKDSWSKTCINKPKPRQDNSNLSEEEREELYKKFVKENESKLKQFGMLAKWEDCRLFLTEHPHLCCEDTANYLAMWCLNLEMEEKSNLADHVAKQVIAMQYILELSKQLDCDPRSCIQGFFKRIQTADKEYQDAFNDELSSFKMRIKERAKVKMAKIMAEIEEEERQKRLGPGGLDPVEVYEQLPPQLQACFDSKDIQLLQDTIKEMDPAEAEKWMKMCVDSGLWVPDRSKVNPGDPEIEPSGLVKVTDEEVLEQTGDEKKEEEEEEASSSKTSAKEEPEPVYESLSE